MSLASSTFTHIDGITYSKYGRIVAGYTPDRPDITAYITTIASQVNFACQTAPTHANRYQVYLTRQLAQAGISVRFLAATWASSM